jgi:hypothetical protein
MHPEASTAPEAVQTDPTYKEVARDQTQPEPVVYAHYGQAPETYYHPDKSGPLAHGQDESRERSVCGLTQRNFMILAIVALIIIGVAVGGGVGGGLAARFVFSTDHHQDIRIEKMY